MSTNSRSLSACIYPIYVLSRHDHPEPVSVRMNESWLDASINQQAVGEATSGVFRNLHNRLFTRSPIDNWRLKFREHRTSLMGTQYFLAWKLAGGIFVFLAGNPLPWVFIIIWWEIRTSNGLRPDKRQHTPSTQTDAPKRPCTSSKTQTTQNIQHH